MSDDPNNPELLTTVATGIEAGALCTALSAYDVESSTTGHFTAGFRAEAPGRIQIWVRRKDLEKAQQALIEIENSVHDIDWSQVDVGKPDE